MANKNTTLTGLFTDIADAIREKTGGTETIIADNFPEAIAAIETCPEDALFLKEIVGEDIDYGIIGTEIEFISVAYGNGQFIAIAKNSNIPYHSIDGINWEPGYELPCTAPKQIVYGNHGFVIIPEHPLDKVCYSADGDIWLDCEIPFQEILNNNSSEFPPNDEPGLTFSGGINNSITWVKDRYIIFSEIGIEEDWDSCLFVIYTYSYDGSTWNANQSRVFQETDLNIASIAYGNNKFCAAIDGTTYDTSSEENYMSTDIIYYSNDGINWNSTILPSYGKWVVAYGNNKFVIANKEDGSTYYSEDCINWIPMTIPENYSYYAHLTLGYYNDKFILTITYEDELIETDEYNTHGWYSTNGTSWRPMALPELECEAVPDEYLNYWGLFCYGNNTYIALSNNFSYVGTPSIKIATSSDGVNWITKKSNDSVEIVNINDEIVTEETVSATGILDSELAKQNSLIDQIMAALEAKDLEIQAQLETLNSQLAEANASWAGELTFSGTYATSTYYTAAGCSLAVDKQKGMAFITIQGGTSTTYENIYFAATSLPSGVTMLTPAGGASATNFGTSGSTECYYTAVLTGITGKINVAVAMNTRSGTSYDAAQCALTVTYA